LQCYELTTLPTRQSTAAPVEERALWHSVWGSKAKLKWGFGEESLGFRCSCDVWNEEIWENKWSR